MSMVGASVMVLLLASTVTAGASPHTFVNNVAVAVRRLADTPFSTILGGTTPKKSTLQSTPKTQSHTDGTQQSSAGNSPSTGATSSSTSSTNSPTGTSQSGTQNVAPSVMLALLQCTPDQTDQSGQQIYAESIGSASLSLPTPLTSAGTITGYWETQYDSSGSNAGQPASQPSSSALAEQPIAAGVSSVTIPAAGQAQPLYSTDSNTTYSYKFRLHITSPVDVTSSWVDVPVTTGSCPTQASN
jgi:hypothetical protein